MDFLFIIKERFGFLFIFIMLIIMSLLLLFAVWKDRSYVPRSLTIIINTLSIIIIIASIAAFVFALSFGYNS